MRKVDIATNQGHLSFDENGTILLYSSTTAYDIAMISKNTRDNVFSQPIN